MMASTPLLLGSVLLAFAADPPCTTGGSTAHVSDEARALAACEHARQRFSALFGRTAPRAHVVLHDEQHYEIGLVQDVGVVWWPAAPSVTAVSSTAQETLRWSEVLPHELMHALTMAHFYAHANAVDANGYGTPLPDWFEEGVAIWAEPESSRAGRLAHARSLPADRLDMRVLLAGRHPAADNPDIIAAVPGAAVPRDAALRAFYPQSFALVSYVHARGGGAAMTELGRRLAADPSNVSALAGLPGLPATMAAVERDWGAWLDAGR